MKYALKITAGLFAVCCLYAQSAKAQAQEDLNRLKEKYPKEDIVCNLFDQTLDIKLKDGKPVVEYATTEEFFYLAENNSGYTKRSFHVSSTFNLKEYKATLYSPDGNSYKKSEVKDFQYNDFEDNHIFYDDSKELNFMFPQIKQGSRTVIFNAYEVTDAHFLPKFSLSPYLNYEKYKLTIKADQAIELKFDSFNTAGLQFAYSHVVKGKTHIYTWEGTYPKKYDFESNGPSRSQLSPQIFVRIMQYNNRNEKVNMIHDLKDLYSWNCSFLAKTQENADLLKPLSDSIVGNATDPIQKASRIFNWVQQNIRYIALEYGYDGFIPAGASTVCKERYGDCKGISNLLYNLLLSQKLDAHLCWIGTRDIPFNFSEITSQGASNHMITALRNGKNWIFLDGTASNVPFGLPSPFIQDKEAMISIKACDSFELAKVPVTSAMTNLSYDSCYIKIEGRNLIGKGITILNGYKKMNLADHYSERNYHNLLNMCRGYLLRGNNKFVLDTVWVENLDDRNLPLQIHYSFRIPDYAVFVDNEYYINPNLDKVDVPERIPAKRNVSMEFRFAGAEINVTLFELPKDMKLAEVPQNTNWSQGSYLFSNTFELKNNILYRNSTYKRENLSIPVSEFGVYNTLIDQMNKSFSEQITLTRIKP